MDFEVIKEYLTNKNYENLTEILKINFQIKTNEFNGHPVRLEITDKHIEILQLILTEFVYNKTTTELENCQNRQLNVNEKQSNTEENLLEQQPSTQEKQSNSEIESNCEQEQLNFNKKRTNFESKVIKQLINVTFKSLRNSVVLNGDVQLKIAKNNEITKSTRFFYELFLKTNDYDLIKMILQFLTNLVVDNSITGEIIWKQYADEFVSLLNNKTLSFNSGALLYNILIKNDKISMNDELITSIFDLYENNSNEYINFLVEFCCHCNIYVRLCTKQRTIVLEQLKSYLLDDMENVCKISDDFLVILIDDFKKKSDCILKTVTSYLDEIEPFEISLLLDILSMVSSDESHLIRIQSDKSLLINCVFLLKSIHDLGKVDDGDENYFSGIKKLSNQDDSGDFNRHPAFGFKAALIRIIGNIGWKNRCNQDQLRELDSIPLLLDCCNMDARNPFIIQWTVFAIRNLCEKNEENQRIIGSLTKKGYVDSAVLNEMGITLESDGDNEIKIVPFDGIK